MTPAPKDAPSSAKATEGRPAEPDFDQWALELDGDYSESMLEDVADKLCAASAAGRQAALAEAERIGMEWRTDYWRVQALADDRLHRIAALEAALREARTQLFALCKDTEMHCASIAEQDIENKVGAFARGRIKEAKSIRNAMDEVFRKSLSPTASPPEGQEESGMFRDHSCWKCKDGARACIVGNPRQCEYPHARND